MTHGLVATRDGEILGATAGMEALLSGERGSEAGKLTAQPLWRFLTAESAQDLRRRVATGSRAVKLRFLLTFAAAESGRHLLICNLDVQPNAFALLCEPVSAAAPEAGVTR